IRQRSSRDIVALAARGDAAAARRRLEDQEFDIQQREQKAARADIDARKDIDKRLREQLEVIKERYDEQVAAAHAQAIRLGNQEQARYDKEIADRQVALDKARADLAYASGLWTTAANEAVVASQTMSTG